MKKNKKKKLKNIKKKRKIPLKTKKKIKKKKKIKNLKKKKAKKKKPIFKKKIKNVEFVEIILRKEKSQFGLQINILRLSFVKNVVLYLQIHAFQRKDLINTINQTWIEGLSQKKK